jgi:hypothetical protein
MTEMRQLHAYDCRHSDWPWTSQWEVRVRIRAQAVLLVLLAAAAVITVVPRPAAAEPETCPPVCDRIPASAWPNPRALPLDDSYRWPGPAQLATPASPPRFRFEELCAGPVPPDPRVFAVAARALAARPRGEWQLQAQVVHWRGETWRGGQMATAVFDAAVRALRACQMSAPGFSPSLTTALPDRMAAVISGPVVVHQYLLVDPRSSSIAELSFSAEGGPAQWPIVPDDQVFGAMAAPLCAAYLGSCG